MSEIKKVALAGASGNLGTHVLKALLAIPSLQITVLTRQDSTNTFSPTIAPKPVDYTSLDSLVAALEGQDALINTTNVHDPSQALLLAEAAIKAGVKRYIPADFGMDPENANIASLPVFGAKTAVYKYLKEKVAAAGAGAAFSYTVVACGPFLDANVKGVVLGLDVPARKAELYDGGGNVIPWTLLSDVGRGTAGVLLRAGETRNRVVYISSVRMSQKRMVELAREAVGGGWKVEEVDIGERYERGMGELREGKFSMGAVLAQIQYATARGEFLNTGPWEGGDNALLGVEEMSDEAVREMMRGFV